MSDLPERISVREVGPRDGLQNEDPVPTEAKIELIDRLSTTGVQRIEAVSFVRPEAIPQMADADAVWQGIVRAPSIRYSALVPNLRGAQRALDRGLTEIEAVVSASDTHNRKNVNRSTEESLDGIAAVIDQAHQRGASCQVIVSTAWGCPYEGDVPVERVVRVAGRAVADGADCVSFGDTTGMATPRRVRELVGDHDEDVLEQHAERQQDDAERGQRVEPGEGRSKERGDRAADDEQAEDDIAETVVEEEAQARLGDPLEAADHLHQASQEALLAWACQLEPAPALRQPDPASPEDQLQCEQHSDHLEDVGCATGGERQG